MSLVLALGLLLNAADADTGVVVGRRTALTVADANAVAGVVSSLLVARGVPIRPDADASRAALERLGVRDSAACNGRKACLQELGRQLAVRWLLTLSIADVGTDRSLALELLEISTGAVAEKEAFILTPGSLPTAEVLEGFAGRLKARLAPSVAPLPIDRPVVEPPPPPPLSVVDPPPPAGLAVPPPTPAEVPRSHIAPIVLGVAAGAALIAGGILLASGAAARTDAYRVEAVGGELRSPWSAGETRAKAAAANGLMGIGGGVAALGLGLGVGAVIAW